MDDVMRLAPGALLRRSLAWIVVAVSILVWPALGNPTVYPVLVLFLLALFLGVERADLSWVVRQRWIQLFLVAFGLIAVAFSLNATVPEDYGHILDFLVLPLSIPITLLVMQLGPRFDTVRLAQLCLASAAIALAVAVYGSVVLQEGRASGYELSPIQFADLAVIMGFMALGGFFVGGASRHWYLLAGPFLGLGAAILAGTRGALLVALALCVVFVVCYVIFHPAKRKTKFRILALLAAAVIVSLAWGYFAASSRFLDAITVATKLLQGSEIDSSSAYRLEMYSSGLRAFLDSPIFGHGWTKQLESALPYMSPMGQEGYRVEKWGYIHNEALSFAVGAGLLGLLAYIVWMIAPFVGLAGIAPDTQSSARIYFISILVIGLLVAGLTEVLFMSELSKTLLVILVSVILVACRDRKGLQQ